MRRKNTRSAVDFYRAALDAAKQAGAALPPFWRAEVDPAGVLSTKRRQAIRRTFKAYHRRLANLGSAGTERVSHAIDILMESAAYIFRSPPIFIFRGLPQQEFYQTGDFPWVAALEAQTGIIRQELQGVLADGAGIMPYIREQSDRANTAEMSLGLLNDPGWSSFHLIQNGEENPENASRCPQTMAALGTCRSPR